MCERTASGIGRPLCPECFVQLSYPHGMAWHLGLSGQDSLILDTERSIFPTKIIFHSRFDSARVATLAINLYHMCLTLLRDKGSQDDTFLSLLMARSASGVLYPKPTFLPVRWLCAGVSVQTRTNNSYKRILLTLQFNSTPLRKSGSSLVSFIVSDRLASVCTWSVFSTTADSCGFLRWSSTQKIRALTCKHIPHVWDLKTLKSGPQEKSLEDNYTHSPDFRSWNSELWQLWLTLWFLNGLSWEKKKKWW